MENIIEKVKTFFANMTKQQKIIAAAVAAVVVIVIIIGIVVAAMGTGTNGPANSEKGDVTTYTVEIKTEGGKAFEKLDVYVYEDDTLADLVAVGKTDETGTYTFEAAASDKYVAVLQNMPAGYPVEESYTFTEGKLSLTLKAELLSVDSIASTTFKLGDVMADMSITVDGKTYTISELLKEKKAVVLNFWYEGCDPCRAEFPYMEEAYQQYSDKLEILAVNPYDGDDASVAAYKASMGLTFPMAKVDAQWQTAMGVIAYPTTVVIDRYGTIGFMHTGSVPSTDSFVQLFEYFTSDNYVQTTVKNLDDVVVKVEGGEGTKDSPYEEYRTEFQVEVEAGAEVYYQMYKVSGMILEIADPNAYVLYGDQKYEAVDGKVNVILTTPDTYTPAVFAIGNTASEKKTFDVTLGFVQGSSGNPFTMNLGDFNVAIEAGNEQGVYYTYTATENGTLTLNCTSATAGVEYDFTLYNTVSSALRNLSSDGDSDTAVSITVNAGDVVQFSVAALPNDENEYPAADFTFNASFEKGEGTGIDPNATVDYKVIVKDSKGNAVSNVNVTISSESVSNVVDTAKTNKSGVATITLTGGNYIVTVTAPSGYKADATEYILTKQNNELTITLEKEATTVAKKTYTVTVVDESGKAIAGAGVTVGSGNFANTDNSGKVSFSLEEGDYSVTVTVSGYTMSGTYSLSASATSTTVTMKKETVASKEITYTVTVVNYKGSAVKNVNVQFMSNGAVVADVAVDSKGVATATLKEGTYTAIVSDNKYGSGTVTLTAQAPESKLIAAEPVDTSDSEVMCEQTVVTTKLGARYAKLNSGDNYFVYTPNKSGKYLIRTDSSQAVTTNGSDEKVAYSGSSQHYLATPNYEGNEIVINVTDDQVGHTICVFSVTGSTDTVIVIERIGDAEVAEECAEYKGTSTPSTYVHTVPAGTQKWVDVTGNFTIVKGSDGYYHKDSATGPIIYVTLGGDNIQYISMKDLLDNGPLRNYDKMEDYTALMLKYVECMDENYGIYPLTDDLMYMFQNGGAAKGWYDKGTDSGFYLFGENTVNQDIAWMFECCYWE